MIYPKGRRIYCPVLHHLTRSRCRPPSGSWQALRRWAWAVGDLDREPPDIGRTGRARCWAPHAWANPERKIKRGQPERKQPPPGVKLSQLDQWRTNITISPETTITQGAASRPPFKFLPQVPQKRPLTWIKPTAGQFTTLEPKGRETGRFWLLYGCIARRGATREPGPCRGSCPAPHHLTCSPGGWPPDDPQKTPICV